MDEHMLNNLLNLEPLCQLKQEADPSRDGIASESSKPKGSVASTWPAPRIERLNLLVIEDNAAILKNAKRFFSTLSLPFPLHVRYAGTLLSAQKHLKDADALICDFYFPRHAEGVREALAKPLIQTALDLGLPCVAIGNMLDQRLQLPQYLRRNWKDLRNYLFPLNLPDIDASCSGCTDWDLQDYNAHDPAYKPWNQALHMVLYQIIGIRMGLLRLDPVKGLRRIEDGQSCGSKFASPILLSEARFSNDAPNKKPDASLQLPPQDVSVERWSWQFCPMNPFDGFFLRQEWIRKDPISKALADLIGYDYE